MTELNELREALSERAAQVSESGAATRPGQIRQRVRVVRRRRRAVGAGSAAVLLAVVAGVALLPDASRNPTPDVANSLVGVTPPSEMTSLGYSFTLQRGVEGETDTAILDVAPSGERRLISWATEGENDTVTVSDGVSNERLVYQSSDFSDFVLIPEGGSGRIEVTSADGSRVGLASYSIDLDSPPPGVSKDGVTFRDEVAGKRLLAAEIGDLGVTELTLETTSRGPQTGTAVFCAGAPRGAFLHVDRGDAQYIGDEACTGRAPVDVDPGVTTPTRAGQAWKVRIYLTDGEDGPVIDAAGARIGVAAYDVPQSAGPAPWDATSTGLIEYGGHVYRQTEILEVPDGRQRARVPLPETETPTLVFGYAKARSGMTRFSLQGELKVQRFELGASGGVSGIGLGLFSGPDVAVTVSRVGADANAGAAVAIYERVD